MLEALVSNDSVELRGECNGEKSGVQGGPDMRKLSAKQQEVLDAVRGHLRRTGVPPSRAELADELGTHPSTVDWHLMKLAQKGWIELLPDKQRGIRLVNGDRPIVEPLGEIAAGEPVLAESRTIGQMPETWANRFSPQPDYFLTVQGDSMNGLGLQTGDMVAVKARREAHNGEVVVARLGNEVTLKRYRRLDRRHVLLEPVSDNPAHAPRRVDLAEEELHIDGVVVGTLIGAAVTVSADHDAEHWRCGEGRDAHGESDRSRER